MGIVLKHLGEGPQRSGALTRAIPGVTRKVLTETLRALEADGIVQREVVATNPPAVTYALTTRGGDLLAVLAAVTAWAEP